MKKLFPLLFLMFGLVSCDLFIGPDPVSCEVGAFIRDNYTFDAKHILAKEIYNDPEHPDRDNPYLSNKEVNTILGRMQAVYNLNTPESELVFDTYKIHVFRIVSLSRLSLGVDPEAKEIKNLVNGIRPTGNATLDRILYEFGFDSVRVSYYYPEFNWLTLVTEGEYNLVPIAEELRGLSSVSYAEFYGAVGDGDDINRRITDDGVILDFSIGRGDCPSGCLHHEHWEFLTNDKCGAELHDHYEGNPK